MDIEYKIFIDKFMAVCALLIGLWCVFFYKKIGVDAAREQSERCRKYFKLKKDFKSEMYQIPFLLAGILSVIFSLLVLVGKIQLK